MEYIITTTIDDIVIAGEFRSESLPFLPNIGETISCTFGVGGAIGVVKSRTLNMG